MTHLLRFDSPAKISASSGPCRQCGACCRYEIPVQLLDLAHLARALDLSEPDVFDRMIRPEVSARSGMYVLAKQPDGRCIFLGEDLRCAVHQDKPWACKLYHCDDQQPRDALPWTARCGQLQDQIALWEVSVVCEITRSYARRHGAGYNEHDFASALGSIDSHLERSPDTRVRLGRREDGSCLCMVYDCSQCEGRGTHARETPVTLGDLRRIAAHLGEDLPTCFSSYVSDRVSALSGALQLRRPNRCVFSVASHCCRVQPVRPFHCRFTPCPKRTTDPELADSLYLGSGSLKDQFEHQVALSITREYVATCGARYDRAAFRSGLRRLDASMSDSHQFEEFCRLIAPYRYVDDAANVLLLGEGAEECSPS